MTSEQQGGAESPRVEVEVAATYLPDHSNPEGDLYTYAYTITIRNHSTVAVQLLSRYWRITDANNEVQEVRGEGVVGEQPVIPPGEFYRYTSGATLATPVGCMEGRYYMVIPQESVAAPPERFQVPIPAFSLHTPTALH